jgi:hypothetical protein
VVGEVGANPRTVRDHPDPLLDELLGRADTGQQQQMRAADGARRQDDFPLGPGHLLHPTAEITNPRGAAAVDDDPGDERVGVHGQVRPGDGGVKVGVRG